jgi:hypothetical protein
VVTSSGEWDYKFLTSNLLSTFALQVLNIPTSIDTDGYDNIGWGGTNTRDSVSQFKVPMILKILELIP